MKLFEFYSAFHSMKSLGYFKMKNRKKKKKGVVFEVILIDFLLNTMTIAKEIDESCLVVITCFLSADKNSFNYSRFLKMIFFCIFAYRTAYTFVCIITRHSSQKQF